MELQLVENLSKDQNGNIVFNNNIRISINDIKVVDSITVDELTEHRMYLISEAVFGTPDWMDLLILFNSINNPYYLPIGTKVKIPDLNEIQAKVILHKQMNKEYDTRNLTLRNSLTAKITESSNVQRSDGRLIYSKKN